MARQRKNKSREDQTIETAHQGRRGKRVHNETKRRRRWPYVFAAGFALLAIFPNLIAWTGLHQRLINYALKDFGGTISVKQATLGWAQSVSLTGIKAVDVQGNELLTVDRVLTSESLIQLISSYFRTGNFGEITVHAPVARLSLRPDGSNLEDALAKYFTAASQQKSNHTLTSTAAANLPASSIASPAPSHPIPKFYLTINDGKAWITSSTDRLVWQLDGINVLLSSGLTSPLVAESLCTVTELELDAEGKPQPIQTGQLQFKTEIDPGSPDLMFESLQLALNAQGVPVSLVAPLAQRFIGSARSSGQLTTKLTTQVDLKKLELGLDVQSLTARDLFFLAPELMKNDQLRVRNVNANGRMQISPKMISSNQFELHTDFGKLKSNGSFDVKQLAQMTSEGQLLAEPLELEGNIELAALVRMLPETFRLHQDLEVESGIISFHANTKSEGDTRRLVFHADAANLKGRRGGQMLVWQQAMKLGGTIRQLGRDLSLESLDFQSDFLRLAGSATLESGSFVMKGDLSKLAQRVGQFIDLSQIELAGMIDGNLGWQAAEGVSLTAHRPLPLQLGGQFHLDQPIIKFSELPVWRPEQLLIRFSGAGIAQMDSQTSETMIEIQTGGAQIDIGQENATALLAAPLRSFGSPVSLNCELNGRISHWLAHLRNFVDIGELQSDGIAAIKGLVTFKEGQVQFTQLQYEAEQFAIDGYGMKIRDPKVNGTVDGYYDPAKYEIRLRDMTLISSSIAARGQELRFAFANEFYADGGIGFRGDVNRIAEWFELSTEPESIHWFGSAEGTFQFVSQDQGVASRVSVTLADLVAAHQQSHTDPTTGIVERPKWVELYRDPRVQVDSELLIANDFNAIMLQNGTIKSSTVSLEASGTVADLTGTLLANIQGRWTPAWDKVQTLVAVYTGNLVQLSGSGTKPFSLRGPLLNDAEAAGQEIAQASWIPSDLEGSIAMGWDQGSFLEVPIGASEINLDVKNSVGYIGTKGIPFSGGTIQLAPYVDMRGRKPFVSMKPTRVIDGVSLSRDTARKWLKYVAPLAADATSAQGNLTLDVEAMQMPLFSPLDIEANGTMQLADVVIGAGPLAEQLLGTVQQVRSLLKPDARERDLTTWLLLSQQSIPFVVKDQSVFHENVTIMIKDIPVTTSGVVGFDQSLKMVAEIPIADEWISGKPYLNGLRGQKLRIPITGTVSKPVLDHRAIQGLSSELARGAASNVLNQALTDHLTPKANELQEKLSGKVSGELNRFQDRLGEKVGALGALGNLGAANPNAPQGNRNDPSVVTGTTNPVEAGNSAGGNSAPQDSALTPKEIGKQLEDDLKKGFNDLFKPKR